MRIERSWTRFAAKGCIKRERSIGLMSCPHWTVVCQYDKGDEARVTARVFDATCGPTALDDDGTPNEPHARSLVLVKVSSRNCAAHAQKFIYRLGIIYS